jgi:hypothetical protein
MFDPAEELDGLRRDLNDRAVPYALCGGLAMAIHGSPRSTVDIDLFVREQDVEAVEDVAVQRGFTIRAKPMTFSGGAVRIRRISKIDPGDGDTLMLDLLLVTAASEQVWETREVKTWRGAPLGVVSAEGLITLKSFRMSLQDQADIAKLRGQE